MTLRNFMKEGLGMRKLIASVFCLVASAVGASAADLPMKASPAYGVPAAYSWSGAYIGGQIGYGWAGIEPNDADVLAMFGPGLTYSNPSPAHGFLGGLTIGNNWQFGPWVYGVEGDFSWSDVKGSFNGVVGANNVHLDAKLNWLATVRARAGYAFGPALIYGTAGAAIANISGNYINVTPGAVFTVSESHTHVGWTAGAGVEYAITRNLSAKIEGLYVGLAEEQYQNVRFKGEIGLVRAGVNWRF